jgi:hypothetical protein
MRTESWDEVVASLTAAYGLVASDTTLGEHSALTVELGEAESDGRYRLEIYGAAWRLEDVDTVLAGSADERDDVAEQVARLDGRALVSVAVEPRSLSARFAFDGGLSLITFSVYTHGVEHWALRRPDGTVVTAGPGSAWSIGSKEGG